MHESARAWARAMASLLFALSLGFPGPAGAQERAVELELVLAIDISSSVSAAEFELQKQGLSEALRHPDVQAAIRALGDGGLALALVQWSGNRMQRLSVDWADLRDAAGAERFAGAVAAVERPFTGTTSLGGAIRFSVKEIEANGFEGRRKVIDISGDGYGGLSPRRERDRAIERGMTINGLAIQDEVPDLGAYFAAQVVGGPGAFVMTVEGIEDFGDAIREKLIREIAGFTLAGRSD